MLATVFQKRPHLVMSSTEVKDQAVTLPLEDQAQIQATSAFHERNDAPQTHPGMQMRNSIGQGCGFHGGQDFCPTFARDASKKARRGKSFH
jgi:hypothetical protein